MKKIYLLIILVLFVGCSKIPLIPESTSGAERQNKLEQITRWKLKGRLALTTPNESWTVTLRWSQDYDRYLMQFVAPLGQGTYALRGGEGSGVYLLTAKNEVFRADDAESLLKQTVGWHVPMSGFRYWVRGLPEPGVEILNREFDDQGRILEMQQEDWHISLSRYIDVDGVRLPGKVFMQNDHFKLKLVIHEWDTKL